MSILDKKYLIIKDAPSSIGWEDYEDQILDEYNKLLSMKENQENVFQEFFEKNPSFIPGALELLGQSGHYPYMDCLISQPQIGNAFSRKPDFLWLANDSLNFVPVFVEIERPSKKMFNSAGTTTAEFNQALEQIHEWKYLLKKPVNQLVFYNYFNLPEDIREKTFKPQFLLIYGRRSEYEGNYFLTGKRAAQETEDMRVMSFDRLRPLSDYRQFVSCKVSNQKYKVLNIAPTYKYRADCADNLVKYINFLECINTMKYTSDERKQLLKERYNYWIEYGKLPQKGLMIGQEGE